MNSSLSSIILNLNFRRSTFRSLKTLTSCDDPLNQKMTHPLRQSQSRGLVVGQVGLGHIAGHRHLGAEAQPGQHHFHLGRSGVLGLVHNHKGLAQCATMHVGQGSHLDRTFFHQHRNLLRIDELMHGIIEGSQIGSDLLLQVTGQEGRTEWVTKIPDLKDLEENVQGDRVATRKRS
jgi:hypothetical protein